MKNKKNKKIKQININIINRKRFKNVFQKRQFETKTKMRNNNERQKNT